MRRPRVFLQLLHQLRLGLRARSIREEVLASSIKSTALEPTRFELAHATPLEQIRRLAGQGVLTLTKTGIVLNAPIVKVGM